MRLHVIVYVSAALAACGDASTNVDDALLEYRAPLVGTFNEVFSYPGNIGKGPLTPTQCTVHSMLSGTVRVKLQKQGELNGAEAGVDITERIIGATALPATATCSSSRSVRPYGEWTAPIEGTPAELSFSMVRTSSSETMTIRFKGSLANNVIVGTLTYSRTSSSGGGSRGTADFPVTLKIAQTPPAELNGTWTGNLTLNWDGTTATRGTALAITQTGSNITGQLQFAGGEINVVEGTVSGSTIAITATPRPNSDNCERYSFGIAFVIQANQLNASAATGTLCEPGGQTLRQLSGISGVLTR